MSCVAGTCVEAGERIRGDGGQVGIDDSPNPQVGKGQPIISRRCLPEANLVVQKIRDTGKDALHNPSPSNSLSSICVMCAIALCSKTWLSIGGSAKFGPMNHVS